MGIIVYYAKSINQFGEKETVAHHLQQVSALCKTFAAVFDCPSEGALMGLFHDFGKYGDLFQKVLEHQAQGVDHATPGAAALLSRLFQGKSGDFAVSTSRWLLIAAVMAHHGTLRYDCYASAVGVFDDTQTVGQGGKTLSIAGRTQMAKAAQQFLHENIIDKHPPHIESFQNTDYPKLAHMLYGRMLFSALVDADYCASATHENPQYLEETTEQLPDVNWLCDSLSRHCAVLQQNSQAAPFLNEIRTRVYENCRQAGAGSDGVFTLTAPTGTGKTMAMLAFALEQLRRGKRRIFFVLPFLSITEQNAKEYRSILPTLLECHSQSNLSEEMREFAQRWSSYAIVTTSVQFFESLFASRSTDCRRLHQIAGSVILFDEAQTLPPDLARATLDTLNLLCERYHCTVVFSTATQPSFQYIPNVRWQPKEIIDSPRELLLSCRRVQVEWNIQKATSLTCIAQQMSNSDSACCIVNLRRHGKELFSQLQSLCPAETVFFMTTDLCPAHRQQNLAVIRQRLRDKLPCRLVATQCIEAGVDISFDVLFRALAPLESIIQAAGRCNRHGGDNLGQVTVFVPDEPGRLYPGDFYEAGANAVKTVLSRHPIDINDLDHIEEYYSTLYRGGSIAEKPSLKAAIDLLDYEKVTEEYKLITQSGYQVIVPYQESLALFERLREEALCTGLTPSLMRQMAPITVTCYGFQTIKANCIPLFPKIHGKRADGYECGWYALEDYGKYDSKMGLCMETTENLLY